MTTSGTTSFSVIGMDKTAATFAAIAVVGGAAFIAMATLSGCASDEPVGVSKTTTTRTTETPNQKVKVTETHTKSTTLDPH